MTPPPPPRPRRRGRAAACHTPARALFLVVPAHRPCIAAHSSQPVPECARLCTCVRIRVCACLRAVAMAMSLVLRLWMWWGCSLVDPGYLRFAYRAPLASDGRGPVVSLVRLKPLHATRPLVVVGVREKKYATFSRFALYRLRLQSEARGARQYKRQKAQPSAAPERNAHTSGECPYVRFR